MRKSTIVSIVIGCGLAIGAMNLSGCASCSRMAKDWNSDLTGGLNRTVKVYDFNGDEVAEYSGKMDLARGDDTWKFDIYQDDGSTKRVIITNPNGILIAEEDGGGGDFSAE